MVSNAFDEEYRQDLLKELGDDERDRWTPGSFGCHELLDRIHIMTNQFESLVVQHNSCILQPEWFHEACRIRDQIDALYQKVGAIHL
jgi:hypothetical protein